jgi:hypothetical protein
MTILSESKNSFLFTTQARIIESDIDTASEWASKYIVSNPALKWIVGKYVEADNANSNGQYWTLSDLRLNQPTIQHSPMNMSHKANHIVGTFVASELIYPTIEEQNPYIETVGAFWKFYFPEELSIIEEAYKQGDLFLSMECISDSVTCVGPMGCGQTFDYAGPMSQTYCDHIKERAAFRQLNNPHFLAGALIAPPDRPGWKNASVNEMSILERNEEKAHDLLNSFSEYAHLSNTQKEGLAASILNMIGEEAEDHMSPVHHPEDENDDEDEEMKNLDAQQWMMMMQELMDSYKNKAASELSVGDLVTWSASGGKAYGKIVKKSTKGTVSAEPNGPKMEGTKDKPAIGVQVWKRNSSGEWNSTDTITVHRMDSLSKINALPKS